MQTPLPSLPQHLTVAFSVFFFMFCQCGIHYTTQVAQKQQVDLSGYALININSDKKQRHFSVFATSKVKKKKEKLVHHEIKS